MSTINPNTSPSSSYTPEFLTNPQKDPEKVEVTGSGAGGASTAVKREDTQNGIPVSQQGIQDPTQIRAVKTNDPVLVAPDLQLGFSELDQKNMQVTNSIIQYAMTLFGMQSQVTLSSLEQQEIGQTKSDDELTFIRQAIEDYAAGPDREISDLQKETSTSDVILPKSGTTKASDTGDPIDDWIKTINNLMAETETVSTENSQILKTLESKDAQDIAQLLIETSGIENLTDITPADKQVAISKFTELATIIAEKNKSGGSYLTGLPIASFLTVVFARTLGIADDSSLSDSQKDLITTLLHNSAEKISSANFQSITNRSESSEEFKILDGEDSTAINTLLSSFVKDIDTSQLTSEQMGSLESILSDLSTKIAGKDFDESIASRLISNNPDIVQQALHSLIGDLSDTSVAVVQLFVNQIVPVIAQNMSAINEVELNAQLKSSNQEDVEKALSVLSGLEYDTSIPTTEKKIIHDYLKVLCEALAFMAQIRSLISRLEGNFTQALAAAKMATASDQVKSAMSLMQTKLEEIQKKYLENADKIRTAAILKYLMPIIAVILLVIAIIVLIVSLVGAIPSGGASAAIGLAVVAKIIALVTAIIVTTAVLVFTVVDTIVNWATNKGILDHIYDAAGITDTTVRKGITMGFNIALAVIIGALTLGVGIIGGIATLASQGAQMTVQTVIMTVLQLLKETLKQLFTGPIGAQVIGLILNALFSSGFVQDILVKMFKAMGLDDEKAMIATMVLMVIIMLMTILATCGKSIMGGIKSAAGAVKEGVKTIVEEGIKQTIINAFKAIVKKLEEIMASLAEKLTDLKNSFMDKVNSVKSGIDTASTILKGGANVALEATLAIIQKVFNRMLEALKDSTELLKNPMNFVKCMEFITAALQISAQGIKAAGAVTSAQLNEDLAKLAKEVAALEAVMEFLKTAGKIGPQVTMDSLNSSAQQLFEDWKKLINMVAGFILDASQRTTELHNKAA